MTAHARHVTGAKAETLQNLAARLYDEAGRDEDRAITMLANYAGNLKRYREELLTVGARAMISALRRSDRDAAIREEPAARTGSGYDAAKHAAGHARASARAGIVGALVRESLMGLQFKRDGKTITLGDATAAELRPVAEHYIGQGATMVRRGRWLERVIAACPAGTVRQNLDEKALRLLKKEADKLPV